MSEEARRTFFSLWCAFLAWHTEIFAGHFLTPHGVNIKLRWSIDSMLKFRTRSPDLKASIFVIMFPTCPWSPKCCQRESSISQGGSKRYLLQRWYQGKWSLFTPCRRPSGILMTSPSYCTIPVTEITSDWCKFHFPRDFRVIPGGHPSLASRGYSDTKNSFILLNVGYKTGPNCSNFPV